MAPWRPTQRPSQATSTSVLSAANSAPPGVTRGYSWRPRLTTAVVITLGVVFAAWLFTPTWADQRGPDSKGFYAAGSLLSRGGDPYDTVQQRAEEDRLYNAQGGIRPGDPGYYAFTPYGYPPLVTRVLALASGTGYPGFYLASAMVLLVAGILGFELLLSVLGWQRRWPARIFFLSSTPMALALFTGSPSTILLLSWSSALWLMRRNRPIWGGAALSVCLLKPPVGLPIAAALLVAGPGRRRTALAGFLLAILAWAAANVAVAGVDEQRRWLGALSGFGGALQPGARASVFSQAGLVGVPALLIDHLPAAAAVAIVGAVLLGLLVWMWRLPGLKATLRQEPWLGLAVLTAAALAITPYIHLNDLVLEAFPLLVIASNPLDVLGRVTLLLSALGAPLRVFLSLLAAATVGRGPSTDSVPGWGVAITALTVVCLALVARRRPAGADSS